MDHLETFDDHVVLKVVKRLKPMRSFGVMAVHRRLRSWECWVSTKQPWSVNDQYQTEVENIYAAGDVGHHLLLLLMTKGAVLVQTWRCEASTWYPNGYLHHSASIGKNEQELTEEKIPYEKLLSVIWLVHKLRVIQWVDSFPSWHFRNFRYSLFWSAEIIHIGQAVMHSPNNTILSKQRLTIQPWPKLTVY